MQFCVMEQKPLTHSLLSPGQTQTLSCKDLQQFTWQMVELNFSFCAILVQLCCLLSGTSLSVLMA